MIQFTLKGNKKREQDRVILGSEGKGREAVFVPKEAPQRSRSALSPHYLSRALR